jgi:hypothetical protein
MVIVMTSDDCEYDITVAGATVDEEDIIVDQHSLGPLGDSNSGYIWEHMDSYHVQRVSFSGNSGPQNSALNVQGILSVSLLFFQQRHNS